MLNKKKNLGGIKLNVFLILIIGALIFIITQKPGLEKQITYNKISHLKADSIQQINIVSTDQKKITFFKKNQLWYTNINAVEQSVVSKKLEPLFNLLHTNSLGSFTASKNQLKQYHLLEPRLTVSFNGLNEDFSIAFGNTEPLKNRRYTLINNQVHLITDVHYYLLLKLANSLKK